MSFSGFCAKPEVEARNRHRSAPANLRILLVSLSRDVGDHDRAESVYLGYRWRPAGFKCR